MKTPANKPDSNGQITRVDILALEVEKKLPHWLSPLAKHAHTHDAARRAKHQQYMAEKKAKAKRSQNAKRWQQLKAKARVALRQGILR